MADGDWTDKARALVKALRGTGPADEVPSWAQPPQSVTDGLRAFGQGLTGDWGNRLTGVPDDVASAATRDSPGAYHAGRILTIGRMGPVGALGTILASRAKLGQGFQTHGSLDNPETWALGVVGPAGSGEDVVPGTLAEAAAKRAMLEAEHEAAREAAAAKPYAATEAAEEAGATLSDLKDALAERLGTQRDAYKEWKSTAKDAAANARDEYNWAKDPAGWEGDAEAQAAALAEAQAKLARYEALPGKLEARAARELPVAKRGAAEAKRAAAEDYKAAQAQEKAAAKAQEAEEATIDRSEDVRTRWFDRRAERQFGEGPYTDAVVEALRKAQAERSAAYSREVEAARNPAPVDWKAQQQDEASRVQRYIIEALRRARSQ